MTTKQDKRAAAIAALKKALGDFDRTEHGVRPGPEEAIPEVRP